MSESSKIFAAAVAGTALGAVGAYLVLKRKRSEMTAGGGVAVAGHADAIRFEGDVIWKKDQGGHRGQMEFNVLRAALELPGAKGIIPQLVGYRVDADGQWIGMKNLTFGLADPAILDVKMGTRTWNTGATDKKMERQGNKAMKSTTGTLGVRVVGGKLKRGNEFITVGHKSSQGEVTNEQELAELLTLFLPAEALRTSALAKLRETQKWWSDQTVFAFYAASLLFAYDTKKMDVVHIRIIDFANAENISTKAEDLSGFGTGFETLIKVVSSLK